MTAGVDSSRFGIGLGVSGADDRVKLGKDHNLGTLSSRIDNRIKAGYAIGIGELVA